MLRNIAVLVTMATAVRCQFLLWSFDIDKDHALLGHNIKTVPLFKPDCMTECQQTLTCFSINIYKDQNGGHMCDLLRSTKKQSPGSFKRRPGYDYAEAKESKFCSKNVCLVEKEALPNMTYMFNSSLFQKITLKTTWEEARQHCQTLGADLASFSSELESRFVFGTLVKASIKDEFATNETYLTRLKMDGQDAGLSLKNGAKYEETDKGTALFFDGSNDFASVQRFPFFNTSFTFGVWLKTSSVKPQSIINDDASYKKSRSFNIKISPTNELHVVLFCSTPITTEEIMLVKSNRTIPVNQWIHIGISLDVYTHSLSIYFNGKLDKTEVGSITAKSLTNFKIPTYNIGKVTYSGGLHFNGTMKDMVMFPRVFEPFEMMALVDGERRAWIGFNDKTSEGLFQWSNGSPLTYQNLEPLNSETRNCGTMSLVTRFPGVWRMRNCEERSFFICKK